MCVRNCAVCCGGLPPLHRTCCAATSTCWAASCRAHLLLTCCSHPVALLPSVLADMSSDGLLNIYGLTRTLAEQNDDFETTIQVGCMANGQGLQAPACLLQPGPSCSCESRWKQAAAGLQPCWPNLCLLPPTSDVALPALLLPHLCCHPPAAFRRRQ